MSYGSTDGSASATIRRHKMKYRCTVYTLSQALVQPVWLLAGMLEDASAGLKLLGAEFSFL